jgi:Uma2 family endonuclease
MAAHLNQLYSNKSNRGKLMVANSAIWTIADLAAMPNDDGWKRYEIIDGKLLVTRAPHIRHQGTGGNIHFELESWSRQTNLGKTFQTPGLVFSALDGVIPDVVWISHDRLIKGIDESGHLIIAPELIVEILSAGEQNIQRDRQVKRKLYSQYGVLEYWIADWPNATLEIYRRSSPTNLLELQITLTTGDELTSPLLPGFVVRVDRLFT